ncbi:MAG TPA: hypothetical protein VII56_23590 [Rhizomicrobium sp.]
MSFSKSAVSAAALCLTLAATGVYAAQAAAPETVIGCITMEKKANAALEANQQSPNYASARQQVNGARTFCGHGQYKMGVEHFAKALDLLGAS